MKTLNIAYNNLLGNQEKFHHIYKKYIKSLILQKVSDTQFSQPKSRREVEMICSVGKRDQAIDQYMNAPDTYNEIFAAASLIRRDILNKNRWKFTRSYHDYEIPTLLEQLLKRIIIGLKNTVDLKAKKKKNVDVTMKNISKIIIMSTKSRKQINNASGEFRQIVETPFSVDLELYIHQKTRSKKVIDTLSKLNLTIPYDRILKIETGIANEISKNIDNNNRGLCTAKHKL